MTPEQQQRAIAEAIGYRQCEVAISQGFRPEESWRKGDEEGISSLPDPDDLNFMHEAEMSLPIPTIDRFTGSRGHFRRELSLITDQPIHATAAQRREAFLKTLNLWKP